MGDSGSMLACVLREAVSQVAAPDVAEKILSAAQEEAGLDQLPDDVVAVEAFVDGALHDVLAEVLGEDAADQVKQDLDPILAQARSRRARSGAHPTRSVQVVDGGGDPLADAPLEIVDSAERQVSRPRTILIADDDQQFLQGLAKSLIAQGFEVFTACDGQAAVQQVHELRPEVVVADLHMPAFGGRQLIKLLRRELGSDAPPVVIMTGNVFAPSSITGAAAVLRKPIDLDALVAAVEQAHWDHAAGI